ncbi:retrotransposon protein [Cucumis melo var. makuwa]|uniref:Retrotransposon protein n=1 Tax=Cucumis melo var. makuwa TaxID=1194695 RepID=A0A5A7VGG0_CUCMM|nr:retrotransposon protein [Cucumis melo var. makuwa]TYK26022.1 retrotransposon protein [Cucumis melo var. makuwa]
MATPSSQSDLSETSNPILESSSNSFVPTSTLFLLSNICNLVPIRLDSTNYILWKYQVSSILKAHSFFGHIDDTLPCPPKHLSSSTLGTNSEINPEYLQWLSRSQALITLINATLSSSALAHVVGSVSSKALWLSLEKPLIDKLVAASISLEDEEILVHTLNGLPVSFNAFRTSIRTRSGNISLEELHTLLISEETTMAKTSAIEAIPTAMAAFHPSQHHSSRGRGRRFHSTGNPIFNSSPNSSNRGINFASGSRGLESNNNFGTQPNHFQPNYNNHGPFLPPSHFTPVHPNQRGIIGSSPSHGPSFRLEANSGYNGRIFCQICHKQEHGALDCYNHMNFSYQDRHSPSQLAAMAVNSMNSQISSENTNNFWLSDSGYNVHMTNELANLNLSNNYNGEETVTVGNGQPLNIENTGSGKLSTPSHTFNLSKILHAPQLATNLLSVHKFCLDNNCVFVFYTDGFLIQDKVTG